MTEPAAVEPQPPPSPRPWDAAQLALKPADAPEYGYVDAQGAHGCTREELTAYVAGFAELLAVWTPDSAHLAMPEEIPFLHEAMQQRTIASARRRLGLFLTVFAGAAMYVVWGGYWKQPGSWPFVVAGLAALAAGWSAYALLSARGLTPARMAAMGEDQRHDLWLRRQPSEVTKWISWCLIAVFVVRYASGEERSARAAALIKSMVRLGEPWRLVTGPMLHLDFLHFFLNFGALIAFGRMVEVHAGRPFVPLVFFLSILGGSIVSTILMPVGASVGASGGLMGFVGFLAVLAWRRRPFLNPGFFRTVMRDLAGVAAFGVVGYAFIDNAAHLGGFLTGAALGALLVPRLRAGNETAAASATPWSLAPGPGVRMAGHVALAAAVGAALLTVAAIRGLWP